MKDLNAMRKYASSQDLRQYKVRRKALENLKYNLLRHQRELEEALFWDLGKSPVEGQMTELTLILSEIDFFLKNLKGLMKVRKVPTPFVHFLSKSYIRYENRGLVLIVAPWNYPIYLSLLPLVGAVAAGNTVLLKLCPKAPASAKIIEELVHSSFMSDHVEVVYREGSNEWVISETFDMIFFTGGTKIGRIYYEKAARDMVPIVLELGGKSPVIVHETAPVETSVSRILFGKLINGGQTCVAADYAIVHKKMVSKFLTELEKRSKEWYPCPLEDPTYPKIIDWESFERLTRMLEEDQISYRADAKSLKIAPLFFLTDRDSVWMKEEIFGPVLPILTYEKEEEIYEIVGNSHPLSLYVFGRDMNFCRRMTENIRYGGGCINDTLIHLTNRHLPFGGVQKSGIGAYHGVNSFEAFSHKKSILRHCFWPEISLRYPPYGIQKKKWIQKLMK